MAVLWSTFFPYLQPYLPGCPEVVMTDHLREAAARFCARSEVWRFDIESDLTYANEADYDLDVPSLSVVENILKLYLDGSPLPRVTDRHYFLSPNVSTSRPTAFAIYRDTQLRFYPTPDASYAFQGTGVLKPSLTATGVEDFIYETHGRCIAYGALGQILLIPQKEWTDLAAGSAYVAMFYKEADDAKGRDLRRAANVFIRQRPFA